MKKLIAALSIVTVLASCGNEATKTDNATNDAANTDNTTTAANVAKDPICGMEYDATWTEYSVSGTDTTWFCSENCKTAYLAQNNTQSTDDAGAQDDHAGHDHE